MSLNAMMKEFMTKYDVAAVPLDGDNLRNMMSLMADEMVELEQELYTSPQSPIGEEVLDKPNAIKEALDVLYVATQRLYRMGVDVDAALAEVHRSNMSKTVTPDKINGEVLIAQKRYPLAYDDSLPDGDYVIRDAATMKVVKPTTYSPAVIQEGVHYDLP